MKIILSLYFLLLIIAGFAQPARLVMAINEDWYFTKEQYDPAKGDRPGTKWERVNLPHTWNAFDVMDDVPGYHRGVCWYRKTVTINRSLQAKNLFLSFEGVNQECEVFVNGRKAGAHVGGYNGFVLPISAFVKFDGSMNEIAVRVDNSHNKNIPPLTADFTFFGGIYRDVYLVATDRVHFSLKDHGSRGVYIQTPVVNEKRATVKIRGTIEAAAPSKVNIVTRIYNRNATAVAQSSSVYDLKPGTTSFVQDIKEIIAPELWSPEKPYLYSVETKMVNAADGTVLDELVNPLGFRWFRFDADKGFFLNGQPYKLVGASRHQDYKDLGNAVPDELALRDLTLLKEMGANFLRVAHYPQDPSVLEACDRIGLLASVEIPVVNEITETEEFFRNCMQMQTEMIRQNYNHPSVIAWCYMNEVLLRLPYNDDKERQKVYFASVARLAKQLDSLTRKEDPARYTMLVNHGDFNRYRAVGLTGIPQLVGWNLYSGWYGGNLAGFPAFLDQHKKELPAKPLLVTEYGADADPRIRSLDPVRFDKSVEYTTRFHQYYFSEMMKRPFVAAAVIWNLADFNSETREETMPHINNKGLLTWDRQRKDPYYYYQSQLAVQPYLKILGEEWKFRVAVADSAGNVATAPLQVATNLESLDLILNGTSLGTRHAVDGICSWQVPFRNGKNTVIVRGQKKGQSFSEEKKVDFTIVPLQLNDATRFDRLNILLGAKRYFIDNEIQQSWIPDQPYKQGGWGSVGGVPFKMAGNSRLPYGTDKNIVDTDRDPVYQTQQVGIQEYRFDVPRGEYEINLHFAELTGGTVKGLPYNLSGSERKEDEVKRAFHVYVNDLLVLENFNIGEQYRIGKAVSRKCRVTISDNGGIRILFKPVIGEAVLNAIQLKKLN
jgi:beta-galactosidase